MAFSGAQVTRLGLYGGSRSPYGSFAGKTAQEIRVGGRSKKRRLAKVPHSQLPWENIPDEIDEQIIKDLERPKLKIVKRAPQPDFDSTLEPERIDREIAKELRRIEAIEKKRKQRKKAIEMLLLS